MSKSINITLVGFGNVGATLALLLLNSSHANRRVCLNIIEPDSNSVGGLLDLAHGLSLYPYAELVLNQAKHFQSSDFIFYTAGIPNAPGASRLSKANENVELVKRVFQGIRFKHQPYIIVITNPVDLISEAIHRFTNLPENKVLGTGTFLDAIRLEYYLSDLSKCPLADIEAMVLGEHGNSQVPIFSQTKVKGASVLEIPEFTTEILSQAESLTKNASTKIRETQEGTRFGVAKCAETLMNYILDGKRHDLCVSLLTNSYYRNLLGISRDVYLSLPVCINQGKVYVKEGIDFSEAELKSLKESASKLLTYSASLL